MLVANYDKHKEDEENKVNIFIVGRFDCPKVALCRILSDKMKKDKCLVNINFMMSFETQFDQNREKLIKEDITFLEYSESPLIYIEKTGSKTKEIIGSLDEFLKWTYKHFNIYEDTRLETLEKITIDNMCKYISMNGNKYCYFDISIDEIMKDKVVFELFYTKCPKTCQNFMGLTKGTNGLTYMNTLIHRVVRNGYIQGGQIKSNHPKSIYDGEFPDESYDIPHSTPGVLGMVKKGNRKHSNECQFYITLSELKHFDGQYVAFGRVIQGYKTIKEIENIDTYLQRPNLSINIEKCGEFII